MIRWRSRCVAVTFLISVLVCGVSSDEVETLLSGADLLKGCQRTAHDIVFVLDVVWENENYNHEIDGIEKFVAIFDMGDGPGQTRFGSRMRDQEIPLSTHSSQSAFIAQLKEQRKGALVGRDLMEYDYNQGELLKTVVDKDFLNMDRPNANVTRIAVVFMVASLLKGNEPYAPYARYAAEKGVEVYVVPIGPWPTLREALALAGNRPSHVIGAASTKDYALTSTMNALFEKIMASDSDGCETS